MNTSLQCSLTRPPGQTKRTILALVTLLGGITVVFLLALVFSRSAQAQALITIDIAPQEQSVLSGQRATFSITVSNLSTTTFSFVSVSAPTDSTNCSNFLTNLGPGSVFSYTCQTLPLSADLTPGFTVAGYPVGATTPVTASAIAIAHAVPWMWIEPELQTAPQGSTAALTVVLSNIGSSTLTNIALLDPLAPDCERAAGTLSDLGPGQGMTYTCQTAALSARLENAATATANISDEGTSLTGKSAAVVEMATPLEISVTPDRQTISPDRPAAFAIMVKNKDSATLTNVAVLDPDAPDCARPAGTLFDLLPGSSLSYECETPPLSDDTTHVVTATATEEGLPVMATGRAEVIVSNLIEITIDPPYQRTLPGTIATFAVTVTNLQDSQPLTDAIVLAPDVPDCSKDSLPVLPPGTSYTYTCQTLAWRKFENRVTVLAIDPALPLDADPIGIMDSASAGVEVYHLPLVFKGFAYGPDLVVDAIVATSNAVTVTIKNEGNASTDDAFWVDLYFDPDQTPTLNQPWTTLAPAGALWGVTQSLAVGESLILTTGGDYYFGPPDSSTPPFPIGVPVYVLVDSVNTETSYGNVRESNEGNNLGGPVISTKGVGQAVVSEQIEPPSANGLPKR